MAIPSAPRLADSQTRACGARPLGAFGARPCPPFANPGSATVFNEDKCKVLHFSNNNGNHEYRMGGIRPTLESVCEERDLSQKVSVPAVTAEALLNESFRNRRFLKGCVTLNVNFR